MTELSDFNKTDNSFEKTSDLADKSDVFDSDLSETEKRSGTDMFHDENEPDISTPDSARYNYHFRQSGYGRLPHGMPMGIRHMPAEMPYSWTDEMFFNRQNRLCRQGIYNAQDYIRSLAAIDDAMERNPQAVIRSLCQSYGVDIPPLSQQTSFQKMKAFETARDEYGYLKHPYFQAVRSTMTDLLKKGMADDLSGAYQKAIWLDDNIRSHLITDCFNKELNRKAAAAQKAKQASFSPHSKSVSDFGAEKTLRQEIEEIFNLL